METPAEPLDQKTEEVPEAYESTRITRAELQRLHTRVAVRLGDVARNGYDTITYGPQPNQSEL